MIMNSSLEQAIEKDINSQVNTEIFSASLEAIEQKHLKKRQWQKFFTLAHWFKGKDNSLSIEKLKEKEILSQQFNELLKANMIDLALEMMKNGYQINTFQYKKLLPIFEKHQFSLTVIEKWLKHGWKIDEKMALNILFDKNTDQQQIVSLFKFEAIPEFPYLSQLFISYLQQPDFEIAYLKHWRKSCSYFHHYNFSSLINILYNHHQYLFKTVTHINDFILLCKEFSNRFKSLEQGGIDYLWFRIKCKDNSQIKQAPYFMNDLIKIYFPDGIKKIMDDTKHNFSAQFVDFVENQSISNKIELKKLPIEAQNIIHDLESIYPDILANLHLLNEQQRFDVNNLMNVKINETLYDYISIPDKYKETLVNKEGKKPIELMMNALYNFSNHIEEIYQTIQQHKVTSLSVKERYSQHFKK